MRGSARQAWLGVVVVSVLLAGCGGPGQANDDGGLPDDADAAPPPPDAGAPDASNSCEDTRRIDRVYYGTPQPTYVPLTPGQILAIGKIGGCSGTLIKPTWVLTAKHCGLDTGDSFCMGEDPSDPDKCVGFARVLDNPASDMTLCELEQDARTLMPAVEPIPIMTLPLDQSWVGKKAEAAGYGQQEDGGYGEREFTAEPIVGLQGHDIRIDGEGVHGVCFGDSGGPLMIIAPDGTTRVEGDLSGGDSSCVGVDTYTRVDTSVAWIEGYTGPTEVGTGCGSVDAEGRCAGGSAIYCGADDQLVSEPCPDACGWDPSAPGYRCISGSDPCGGVDGVGTCDGNTARWCEDGVPHSVDCTSCDEVCDVVGGTGATCIEDPCMGLDYLGHCNGDVAEWCENGALASHDCAAEGKTCGFVNDEVGYYCLD